MALDGAALEWWRAASHQERRGAEERAAASDLDDVAELACCCVGRDSAVRLWCLRTVRHPLFDRAVLVLILVNSLIMAAQDPREAETALTTVSEIVFNVAFTCEMALKMVATGVASGESAYFRDPWNRFDFVTVVCGWLPLAIETAYCAASLDGSCFAVEEGGGPNLTFLRVVRVVKVLKTVQRMPGMRCLVLSLVKSTPLLIQVMEVLLFIFFVFGAIGVQLFMGKLRQHCFDEASETLVSSEGVCSEETGALGGNACGDGQACRDRDYDGRPNDRDTTLNRYISFDNILLGFATVLTTVSLEGWSSTLYALMDALGPAVVVYFVLLVLVGAFFVVNLIVAVIYQAYVTEEAGAETAAIHETKAHFVLEPPEDAGGADSIDAHAWRKRPPSASLALNLYDVLLPDRSEDLAAYGPATAARRRATAAWWRLRDVCCYVATTTAFSHFIMLCIVFNTIILMAEYEGQSDAHRRFNCAANDWLTWIFVWEMVVKMLGTAYVFDEADGRFNLFDCVITLGSIADLVVAHATGGGDCRRGGGDADDDDQDSSSGTFQVLKIGRVLRLVRIFRSLRMVRNWKSMAHILSAVLRSGPGLVNFSCLLMMFSWVYALAGMQMYAGELSGYGLAGSRPRMNFDSIDSALLTVFIVVSGENWDTVLDYAFRANGYVGLLFIVSMYLVGNFIVLNIFLAILLSNFEMAVDSTNATLYDELEQSNEILVLLKTVAHWAKRLLITAQLRAANSKLCVRVFGAAGCGFGSGAGAGGPSPKGSGSPSSSRGGSSRVTDAALACCGRVRSAAHRPLASAQKSARSLELGVEHLLEATGILGHDDDHWERTVDGRLEDIVEQMQEELPTGTHHRGRREYHDCFPGSVAVDWALESGTARTVSDATDLGQKLLDERLIAPTDVDVTSKFQRMLADLKNSPSSRANRAYATSASAGDGGASPLKTPSQAQRLSTRSESTLRGLELQEVEETCTRQLAAEVTSTSRAAQAAMTFRDNHQLYRFCARHMHRLNIVGDPELLASRRATQSVRDRAALRARTLRGRSLGVLSRRNALRKRAVDVVTHPSFDMLVGVLIVVSSGVLAASDPDGGGSRGKRDALAAADVALTACFCVELLLKVVAQGLVPYLASGWNVLDAFIVAVSVVSLSLGGANLGYLKALRALRALRPLRMIQRYPAMKTVVDALMEAVPDVVNVAFVVVGFFCIFAVAGGTLFRGLLKWCHVSRKSRSDCRRWDIACDYDVTGGDLEYAVHFGRYFVDERECKDYWRGRSSADGGLPWSRFDADKLEGNWNASSPLLAEWRSTQPHYDNLGEALLALFEVATLEGWPALMYAAMDVTEDRHAHPQRNATPAHALFYVIFVVMGSFFVMNIFVGVVVHKFQMAKERTDGASIFLTEQQRGFVDRVKVLLDAGRPKRLRVPRGDCRRAVFYVVVSEGFELAVIAAIVLNMGAISLNHYDQAKAWDDADLGLNLFFTVVFLLELVLKWVGLGPRQYFADPWNRFDAFIVLTSLVDNASEFMATFYHIPLLNAMNLSLFRIFRLARVVKLVNVNPGLKTLLQSLIVSLPSLFNVGSLLVLLIFVYACIGANLYYDVEVSGENITKYNNFQTFGYAMLTLFRCLTGEDWHKVMQEIVDDGNRVSAYPFFATFVILGNFMMLNLCVAVILEAFAEFMNADSEVEKQRGELRSQVAAFKDTWMAHDPENTMFIPSYRIVAFLQDLPPPLGLPAPDDPARRRRSRHFSLGDAPSFAGSASTAGGASPPTPSTPLSAPPSPEDASARDLRPSGDYRLDAQQRFLIEFVRSMRIKVNETQDLFYLDVLMAAIHNGREVDLSSIRDDSTMELNIMLLRCMDAGLRNKMRTHSFRHDLPELDLTHTMNAAVTLQEIFRAKRARRERGEAALAARGGARDDDARRPPVCLLAAKRADRRGGQPTMAGLSAQATGAFFVLVFMQTTAILLFKLCQEEGAYTFSPASSIAITEFAKLAMASGLHYRAVDGAKLFEGLDARIVLNYAGLALLYTTNNYITFHVHLVADPGTYTLGKSVTPYLVAVLLRLSGDRLHELQWLCIVIQCCGIASTQYDPCASASLLPLSTYALIAFSACITSTCGVWNQKVIKGFGTPVNLQNSVLYFFGCLLALAAYAVPPADGSTRVGFLTGYSLLPVVLICFQAFQGLAVAWVLKRGAGAAFLFLARFADAIVKNFAGSATMALLVLLSSVLFGLKTTPVTWLGVVVVLCTTYTYMTIATKLPRGPAPEKDVEAAPPKG
ncbi:hypothetical protein SO694_00088166 [Aureococcus anophagefferens]|uniref:DEP domain-containing protein n=4 Tax=Aureococcus anophagefferens TaxID=44056 RepID=A0ABR1G3M3_AURAN